MTPEEMTSTTIDRDAEEVAWRVRELLQLAAESYRRCNPVALLELAKSDDLSHHPPGYLEELASEADAIGLAHIRAATYLHAAATLKQSHSD